MLIGPRLSLTSNSQGPARALDCYVTRVSHGRLMQLPSFGEDHESHTACYTLPDLHRNPTTTCTAQEPERWQPGVAHRRGRD